VLLASLESSANTLQGAVSSYVDTNNATEISRWIMMLSDKACGDEIKVMLSQAVLDNAINDNNTFKLLIVIWACMQLRNLMDLV
jgi:hypothetical protein